MMRLVRFRLLGTPGPIARVHRLHPKTCWLQARSNRLLYHYLHSFRISLLAFCRAFSVWLSLVLPASAAPPSSQPSTSLWLAKLGLSWKIYATLLPLMIFAFQS